MTTGLIHHHPALAIPERVALQVQDACNLSGVLLAWSGILGDCPDITGDRTHPVNVLFADKVADITGRPGFRDFGKALDACKAACQEQDDDCEGEDHSDEDDDQGGAE